MAPVRNKAVKSGSFGCIEGQEARLFSLDNGEITVRITDYGGRFVCIEAPYRSGCHADVLLGFGDAVAYAQTPGSFGARLGRNADRIADATIVIDGHRYHLSENEDGSTLHGGAVGFDKRFWSVGTLDERALSLTLRSENGDQGFPEDVEVIATYHLAGRELRLVLDARTNQRTPLPLSAHPDFKLEASATPDCLDHRVQIFAQAYLPTDKRQIPTGERRSVAGTAFDFTEPHAIGERIRVLDQQLRYGRGFPSTILQPGDLYHEEIIYRFRTDRQGATA